MVVIHIEMNMHYLVMIPGFFLSRKTRPRYVQNTKISSITFILQSKISDFLNSNA